MFTLTCKELVVSFRNYTGGEAMDHLESVVFGHRLEESNDAALDRVECRSEIGLERRCLCGLLRVCLWLQ